MKNDLLPFVLLALFCLTITACAAKTEGQKLIQVSIELDDKLVFEGKQGVSDKLPTEKIWERLAETKFEVTTDYFDSVSADSQTHALKGAVVVRLKHVNRELGTAELEVLSLKRDPPNSWKLADGEMELIKQAAVQAK